MNLLWKSIINSMSLARILVWKRVANWYLLTFSFNYFFFLFLNFINFHFFFFFLFFLLSISKDSSEETLFLLRFFLFNFFFRFIFTFTFHIQILFNPKFFICNIIRWNCSRIRKFLWNCSVIKKLFFWKVFNLLNLILSAEPFIKIVDIWEESHSLMILFFTLNIYSHFSIPVFSICLCVSYITTSSDVSTLLNCILA